MLTKDAQTYGDREWNRRNFTRPGRPTIATLLDAAPHPRWLATTVLSRGMPRFENIIEFVPEAHRGFFESAFWVRGAMDRGLDWDTVVEMRALWPHKVLIKGVLNVDDVCRAAAAGADGVILSNHGGRQLDSTLSGLDVLGAARAAAGERFTLIVDRGIRRGTDVLKALAVGADAVLVGRAVLYGVAAAGRAGAVRAIDMLREEIDRALALAGVRSAQELDARFVTVLSGRGSTAVPTRRGD